MAWNFELLKRLIDGQVEFIIIGGVAAIVHGSSRTTEDLDICASLQHENAVRIVSALQNVRPRWRMRPDLPLIDAKRFAGREKDKPTVRELEVIREILRRERDKK